MRGTRCPRWAESVEDWEWPAWHQASPGRWGPGWMGEGGSWVRRAGRDCCTWRQKAGRRRPRGPCFLGQVAVLPSVRTLTQTVAVRRAGGMELSRKPCEHLEKCSTENARAWCGLRQDFPLIWCRNRGWLGRQTAPRDSVLLPTHPVFSPSVRSRPPPTTQASSGSTCVRPRRATRGAVSRRNVGALGRCAGCGAQQGTLSVQEHSQAAGRGLFLGPEHPAVLTMLEPCQRVPNDYNIASPSQDSLQVSGWARR